MLCKDNASSQSYFLGAVLVGVMGQHAPKTVFVDQVHRPPSRGTSRCTTHSSHPAKHHVPTNKQNLPSKVHLETVVTGSLLSRKGKSERMR